MQVVEPKFHTLNLDTRSGDKVFIFKSQVAAVLARGSNTEVYLKGCEVPFVVVQRAAEIIDWMFKLDYKLIERPTEPPS